MKTFITILSFLCISSAAAQQGKPVDKIDSTKNVQKVEAACGQCQFGLKAKGCDLAVRINGKSYFVDGTDIDSHGDAHANDGFCNFIRKAEVQGEIVNERFNVSYFKLIKDDTKNNLENNSSL